MMHSALGDDISLHFIGHSFSAFPYFKAASGWRRSLFKDDCGRDDVSGLTAATIWLNIRKLKHIARRHASSPLASFSSLAICYGPVNRLASALLRNVIGKASCRERLARPFVRSYSSRAGTSKSRLCRARMENAAVTAEDDVLEMSK